ncbi:MAG: calcium-translocating P-type ATPase, PMCA-type [Clostridia bacterium]
MSTYTEKLVDVIQELGADTVNGLSEAEAQKRLEQNGKNELKEKPKKKLIVRFLEQFKDVMVIILIIAAIISFVVSQMGGEENGYLEPLIILGIVILNATLGVMQESKAEKALEALKKMSSPHVKVIRDGRQIVVEAKDIVVGDLVLLEAGDLVPADGRLIESASLKCDESALTGESVPANKDYLAEIAENAPLGDRFNMVYSGCSVAYGRARIVVTSTGMGTEIGKIAKLLDTADSGTTPLQKKLAHLGKILGFVALGICAVIFAIGLFTGMGWLEIFMTSVSLAVAAIPEGLPAIVTIVLALGVQRMVKQNAIIKNLPAVETLGSASVICSDKTGTLTQNRMTVVKVYDGTAVADAKSKLNDSMREVVKMGSLCCDGVVAIENGAEVHIGDPTETSIVALGNRIGLEKKDINIECPRVGEIPFDSDRKLMTTINMIDGVPYAIVKGAFDVLYNRCIKGDMEKAKDVNVEMACDALRVITIARKKLDSVPKVAKMEELEYDLEFVGMVGMIDPPREEAKDAVMVCKKAGIKAVMITGDHVLTAKAIATQLGIFNEGDKTATGEELNQISDEDLALHIREYSVFARVSPEDKIRIVKAWQSHNEVVAMTGDGVNDAPALKAADIGCAMGITGTDVAKGAADMTLTDDNFATIVTAVKEGRGIYENIKKAVQFLLSCNIGEIFTVFFAMIIWQKSPLVAMQLLWINLVTDSLPALALGLEETPHGIMERRPKGKNESLFANGLWYYIVGHGFMIAALTLFAFYLGYQGLQPNGVLNLVDGETMAFIVLATSQLFHVFNIKSNSESLLNRDTFKNKYLVGAFAISFLLTIAVVFIKPLATVFNLDADMPAINYIIAMALSFAPIVIVEIQKLIMRLIKKCKKAKA